MIIIINMQKEKFLLEKLKEKEPEEISRYKLDLEKGIDVVVKTAPNIELSKDLRDAEYEAAQIILEQKGRNILDLKKILPKDYKFVFISGETENRERKFVGNVQSIWEHDKVDKIVILPRKWDEGAKDLLGLLHEIGHSWDKDLSKKMKEVSRLYDIIDKIKNLKIKEFQGISLKEARGKYFKLQSEMERDAWAKALIIVREFKKNKGIDLLSPFRGKTAKETRRNLEEYIHGIHSLGAAEEWGLKRGLLEKGLKGIFTTKYYKGEKFTTEHRKKIRRKE